MSEAEEEKVRGRGEGSREREGGCVRDSDRDKIKNGSTVTKI